MDKHSTSYILDSLRFVGMAISVLGSNMLQQTLFDTWLSAKLSKMLAFAASAVVVPLITHL